MRTPAWRTCLTWLRVNVLPGLLISGIVMVALAIVGEISLRATRPFVKPQWVSRFDPMLGFIFEPGAVIRHTNHLDFWAEQKANSFGFLDREPPKTGDHETCRIAFFGDSFVEAAQVPIDRKFHVQLERMWNRQRPKRLLETMAFGYSGTGQANQLPWLTLAKPYKPDVIVLVFVNNDFANNNVWLEAARNGWHPSHPPRPFLVKDEKGQYRWVGPDPTWQQHLLPGQTGSASSAPLQGVWGWLYRRLYEKSYVYTYLYSLWRQYSTPVASYYGNLPAAVGALRQLTEENGRFGDWNPPADLTVDQMFFAEEMPPVFHEALEDTEAALRVWQEHAASIGARLVILASHTLEYSAVPFSGEAARHRRVVESLPLLRLKTLADRLRIPIIEQAAHIRASGGEVKQASFRFDGHWSEYGHRTAAESVKTFLESNPSFCDAAQS